LLSVDIRAYLPRVIAELCVEIRFINTIVIDSQMLSTDAGTEKGRLTLQLLEIIFNQKIIS
jgi:hypothetical protein